jgi:hypothetical protein
VLEIVELKVDVAGRLAPDDPTGDDIIGHIPWHSDLTYTAEPSRGSLDTALSEELLEVAMRQTDAEIPADRQQDHVRRETEPHEGRKLLH